MTSTRNFYIFSQHRTGSRLLCSLLDSHPDIACPHESIDRGLPIVPINKFRGFHGQFRFLTEKYLKADCPKILLYREDVIQTAVSQSIGGSYRAHLLFDLDPGIVRENAKRITENDEIMRQHCTLQISYEELTGGKHVTTLRKGIAEKLLSHIGAPYCRLTSRVPKAAPMLPRNLGDLYACAL